MRPRRHLFRHSSFVCPWPCLAGRKTMLSEATRSALSGASTRRSHEFPQTTWTFLIYANVCKCVDCFSFTYTIPMTMSVSSDFHDTRLQRALVSTGSTSALRAYPDALPRVSLGTLTQRVYLSIQPPNCLWPRQPETSANLVAFGSQEADMP